MGRSGGGDAAIAIIFLILFGILTGSGFYRHSYHIYHPRPTKFTFWAGISGYGILTVIGLFAGFFPALPFALGLYWAYRGGKTIGFL